MGQVGADGQEAEERGCSVNVTGMGHRTRPPCRGWWGNRVLEARVTWVTLQRQATYPLGHPFTFKLLQGKTSYQLSQIATTYPRKSACGFPFEGSSPELGTWQGPQREFIPTRPCPEHLKPKGRVSPVHKHGGGGLKGQGDTLPEPWWPQAIC